MKIVEGFAVVNDINESKSNNPAFPIRYLAFDIRLQLQMLAFYQNT